MIQDSEQRIDPFEPSWHLLGVVDTRKQSHWPDELHCVLGSNFPAQHKYRMTSCRDRALAIIGSDEVIFNSLLFDAMVLQQLENITPRTASRATQHWAFQYHVNVIDRQLDWSQHYAMESLLCLASALYIDRFGHIDRHGDQPGNYVEIIDRNTTDFCCIDEILQAYTFLTSAENWLARHAPQPTTKQETHRDAKALISAQNRTAANTRHSKNKALKNECYEFYRNGSFTSFAQGARSFINQASHESLKIYKDGNAEKVLAEYIGKRVKEE